MSRQMAERIAEQFSPKTMEKHAYFLRASHRSREYLFLENGLMRAFAHDVEGNEVTTHFYTPGNVVFEVSSFFNHIPSSENIQALTDCTGWFVSFEQLNHLFHSIPEFREFGRSILVKGYAGLKMRMLSMITQTAEERYAQLLQSSPELLQAAPLKYIASYLGITDTSLSRIRKEFATK